MKIRILALTVMLCLVGLCLPGVQAQKLDDREVSPKILAFLKPVVIGSMDSDLVKKLKERHNVAVEMLDERVKEYQKGVRRLDQVFEAARLVARAKLEMADSASARLTALDQALEVARFLEDHLKKLVEKGVGSKGDLQSLRFARLTVEVEILKEKAKIGGR